MNVTFEMEKVTKNTIKFAEILPEEGFPAPKVGTLYVPKSTLGELGWSEGKNLTVNLEVSEC